MRCNLSTNNDVERMTTTHAHRIFEMEVGKEKTSGDRKVVAKRKKERRMEAWKKKKTNAEERRCQRRIEARQTAQPKKKEVTERTNNEMIDLIPQNRTEEERTNPK